MTHAISILGLTSDTWYVVYIAAINGVSEQAGKPPNFTIVITEGTY